MQCFNRSLDSWALIASFLSGFLITVLTDGSLSSTGIVTLGLVPVWMHCIRFYIRIKLVINATEQTSKTTATIMSLQEWSLSTFTILGKYFLPWRDLMMSNFRTPAVVLAWIHIFKILVNNNFINLFSVSIQIVVQCGAAAPGLHSQVTKKAKGCNFRLIKVQKTVYLYGYCLVQYLLIRELKHSETNYY